jgi:hypothetical protein
MSSYRRRVADPRERLQTYAENRNDNETTERWDAMVRFAAHHLSERFDHLTFALTDYLTTNHALLRISEKPGPTQKGDPEVEKRIEEERRLFRLIQYRIDIFFVVARMFLDDVATFIDRALAPNGVQCGKHSGVSKHLAEAAGTHGLTGYEAVIEQASTLTVTIKKFRDDFVVHRTVKNPRLLRGLMYGTKLSARLMVGMIGATDSNGPPREHDDLFELRMALDRYLNAVMDLVEQRPVVQAAPVAAN